MDSDLDDFEVIDLPPSPTVTTPAASKTAQPGTVAEAHATRSNPATTDPVFRLLVSVLQDTANARSKGPLFHAKLDLRDKSLFKLYLSSLHEHLRPQHNCHSCRSFLTRFGDLCQVQDDGTLRPLIWPQTPNDQVPAIYRSVVEDFNKLFQGRGVLQEYRITSTSCLVLGELGRGV